MVADRLNLLNRQLGLIILKLLICKSRGVVKRLRIFYEILVNHVTLRLAAPHVTPAEKLPIGCCATATFSDIRHG
jgi:hypothetical protein